MSDFKGQTSIHLKQADLQQAVEFWLNKEILKIPVEVVAVDRDGATDPLHVAVQIKSVPEPTP